MVATAATIITMAIGTTMAVRRYHGHGASSSDFCSGVAASGGEGGLGACAGWACVGAAALSACEVGRHFAALALATCSGVPAWVGAHSGWAG